MEKQKKHEGITVECMIVGAEPEKVKVHAAGEKDSIIDEITEQLSKATVYDNEIKVTDKEQFRIMPDGTIIRGPELLKEIAKERQKAERRHGMEH